MYQIFFYPVAIKSLKKLTSKNSEISKILKDAFNKLRNLDLNLSLRKKKIKILIGVPEKTTTLLQENGFDRAIYEYRDFPKRYPFRVYFIRKGNELYILDVIHHKDLKGKTISRIINTKK